MIKAFGHTAKRAGIEILVRPNATGRRTAVRFVPGGSDCDGQPSSTLALPLFSLGDHLLRGNDTKLRHHGQAVH